MNRIADMRRLKNIIHQARILLLALAISLSLSVSLPAQPPLHDGKLFYGCDYYPEHWDESMWEADARLMAGAGMNVVRMAEFAWAGMEPEEGRYDFSWLDRAIDVMRNHGIKVVLGTPTAAPPAWLVQKYPGILQEDPEGHVRPIGRRRHYCPNDPMFRELTRKIVTHMAEHFRDNPNVIGWQICNEFGESMSEHCYCDDCDEVFRNWLKKRYNTLGTLNKSWGTVFWSQQYSDWSQVTTPTAEAPFVGRNPSLALDYCRFMSDSFIGYQKLQADILRSANKSHFITHNYMSSGFPWVDYFGLARDLDFVSWDNYPGFGGDVSPYHTAFAHDLTRGCKPGNFWVMEEQSGATGWQFNRPIPQPGQVRLWAYQAIAHGADGMVFFRWRSSRFGTEQYWHGILDHDSRLNRRYYEVKQMGEELEKNSGLFAGAEVEAETAIIVPYQNRWAFNMQPLSPTFDYVRHVEGIYESLLRIGCGVSILPSPQNLDRFKTVFLPSYYLLTPEEAESIKHYVHDGGILVVTLRSGVKDINNVNIDKPLPGLLAGLCGVTIEEYDVLEREGENALIWTGSSSADDKYSISAWRETLELNGARPLCTYESGYYAGKPAVTVNKFGNGRAYYIGAQVPGRFYLKLFERELPEIRNRSDWKLPDNVELAVRKKEGKAFYFLLNHNSSPVAVNLPGDYHEILTGKALSGSVIMKPYEVFIAGSASGR